MGKPDIYQHVKDLVRPALVPYGEKARLAKMLGVAQSYINQWIVDGRHNPGADKFPVIAEFLQRPLLDLYAPVITRTKTDSPERKLGDLSRQTLPVDSPSNTNAGGEVHGSRVAIGRIKSRIRQCDRIIKAVTFLRDELSTDLLEIEAVRSARSGIRTVETHRSGTREGATQPRRANAGR